MRIICFSLFVFQFFGCSENEEIVSSDPVAAELSIEEQIMALPNNEFENVELVSLYAESMREILTMAKDPEFRDFIYDSAVDYEKTGQDFDVNFSTIVKAKKSSAKFGNSVSVLENLSSQLKSKSSGRSSMVFFPRAETLEESAKTNKGFSTSKAMKEPVAVFRGAHNDDYSVPSYKLDSNGDLKYAGDVNENYAWKNDVYVIGKAENITTFSAKCENFQKGSGCYGGGGSTGGSSSNKRTDGRREDAGLIQITALNEIEHWTAGKLELRLIVSGLRGSGGTVVNDIKFPKVKRKNFKNEKWYNYNAFLFYWNLSVLADYNIEKWLERDNGITESTLEISIPGSAFKPATATTPSQPALPGTKVSVKYKRGDEDLGTSLVQFSDNITQVYNLGQANFKRQ